MSLIIENWKGYCEHTSQMPQEKMKPVCKACGSDNLSLDASADWDTEQQKWTYELVSVYCENCHHVGSEAFAPIKTSTN